MHFIKKLTYLLFLSGFVFLAVAAPAQPPLPVDEAFAFSGTIKDNKILLQWQIKPGYYLYKERISYKLVEPTAAITEQIRLPAGVKKEDNILGKYEVLSGNIAAEIPLKNEKNIPIRIKVCYQGCSAHGFCYPPETKELLLDPLEAGKLVSGIPTDSPHNVQPSLTEQDTITQLLIDKNSWVILLSFFGFGLLLAFTPCVLPMIPILSGIIIGHNEKKTGHSPFLLSLIYVLAMAATYAIAGVLVGYLGGSIQAKLQSPAIISLFSLIFVLLAFSLFGFYELRLPHTVQDKLSELSNRQKGGTYLGVAAMGVLSTLIVSPCVTPPLIGALAYIGNTGNIVLGGSALFSMGLGMGLPLVLIGTTSGKLLPKAGGWMTVVERFFGVLLLATAIWMMSRILPGQVIMMLWASLLIISAVYMGLLNSQQISGWGKFWRGLGLVMSIYGIVLMLGASMGNTDSLQPLKGHGIFAANLSGMPNAEAVSFKTIKTNDNFDQALQQGIEQNKITLLDFYADWCIACKEMDASTFSDPAVQQALKEIYLLRANVTANDLQDKALMERLKVVAPPTILFFDEKGTEISSLRIIGDMPPAKFLEHLQKLRHY